MRLLRWQLAIALASALLAAAASAEVWQWTDAEGVVRYTPNPDRVPASQRGSLIKLEPGMKIPAASPAAPAVRYAPPEELPLGADPFEAPEPARTLEVPEGEPSAAPETPRAPEAPELPQVEAAPASREPAREAPAPRTPPEEAPEPPPAASEAAAPEIPPGDAPEPPPAPRPLSDAERTRRTQLEAQIAADQETLKELLSRKTGEGDEPLRESPELQEIARRLPALQAELRALDGLPERRGERPAPQP